MGAYAMGTPFTRDEIVADVRAAAQSMVDDVVATHPDLAAGVAIRVEARAGASTDVLVEASEGADVLVIGHRGRGAVTSALLGSVGLACVLHAVCPVTVVRPVRTSLAADTPPSGVAPALA
jgi:nucleotide-binding universal stress UspA family protein